MHLVSQQRRPETYLALAAYIAGLVRRHCTDGSRMIYKNSRLPLPGVYYLCHLAPSDYDPFYFVVAVVTLLVCCV